MSPADPLDHMPGDDRLDDTGTPLVIPAPLGVCAIVGHSPLGPVGTPQSCRRFAEFNRHFGDFEDATVLAAAVQGFFQNGGERCVIVNLGPDERPLRGPDLHPLRRLHDIELVAAPGKCEPSDYDLLLSDCAHTTRLAVLDGPADLSRHLARLRPAGSPHGALYVPWLMVQNPAQAALVAVPPSGHIAGLMARVARERGPIKAPANEPLTGLSRLAQDISQAEQDILHPRRINCIRRMPRIEGCRPWGAQTLAEAEPFRTIGGYRVYAHVVRSVRTGTPWIKGRHPDRELQGRLARAVTAFLDALWQSGNLPGNTAADAFSVRCDSEINPDSSRDQGLVVIEMGLAVGSGKGLYTFRLSLDTGASDESGESGE